MGARFINCDVSDPLKERIKDNCERWGLTRRELVVQAFIEYFERREDKPVDAATAPTNVVPFNAPIDYRNEG